MNLDTVLRRFPLRATLNDESRVVIRPLAPDDKAELRNFSLRVPEEDRYYLNNNVTAPEIIREFTDGIDMERVVPLVAEHDGRIIADSTLHRSRRTGRRHIGELRIVVDPDFRGKGLGSRLTHELIELRRLVFEFTRKRAQSDVVRMEDHNYLMEQCTVGQMREAMHQMGESLVKAGLLDDATDALHISLDELKRVAEGNGPENLRSLTQERKANRTRLLKLTPPSTLGKPTAPSTVDSNVLDLDPTAPTLRGKTASRGRATGTARVLRADAAPPRLHEGDILVTTNVGPDWTPFFPLLAGIVLDSGEIFQHPALVAREYRIPAVFQTRVGTSRIREGQVITVDGDAGIVELGIEGEG